MDITFRGGQITWREMMGKLHILTGRMIEYYGGDPARIQHFLKVHSFADWIAEEEGLEEKEREILEAAALVHDIGIKIAEEKYGSCAGPLQEKEGPAQARWMLEECGYSGELVDRVCYLVGHHHTYTDIDGADYQILVEADFLVNLFEGKESAEAIGQAYRRIFKTGAGKRICREMYGLR